MDDSQIQNETKGQEATAPAEAEKEKSVVEIAKELRDEIREERTKLTEERKRLEDATAKNVLSGTGGIRNEPEPAKEESPKEYMQKVMSGKVK